MVVRKTVYRVLLWKCDLRQLAQVIALGISFLTCKMRRLT